MVVGDEVYLVEIAARGAGSRVYSHIVPYLSGAPVPSMYLQFLMDDPLHLAFPEPGDRAANLAFFNWPTGVVQSIQGLDEARELDGVQEVRLEFEVGDALAPPTDDRSRQGLVLVFGRTRNEVLATTARVFELVRVHVE
jgi:biotin carboxylase